ncbi:MAG: tetratricopeptide repeat protein [Acidobacteriota bacterium]|nr:tetratricopeptide repeat protein [Acidobacteriota bacterium]
MPVYAILMTLLVVFSPAADRKKERQEMLRSIAQLKEQVYALEQKIEVLENKPDPSAKFTDEVLALRAELKDQLKQMREEMTRMNSSLDNLRNRVEELEQRETRVAVNTPAPAEGEEPAAASSVPGDLVQKQLQQARLDFDRGKYDVAETAFRDLLQNFPNSQFSDDCRFYLARCRFQQKAYEEARELFGQVAGKPGNFRLQARLYEGQSNFHLGLFAKAVAIFDEIILNNPDTQEAILAKRFLEKNGLN